MSTYYSTTMTDAQREQLLALDIDIAEFESQLNGSSGTWSFGPLTIEYNFDFSNLSFTFAVYVYKVKIGGGTINRDHPELTVGGSIGFVKAKVKLAADFTNKKIKCDLELIVFGKHYSKSFTLLSW